MNQLSFTGSEKYGDPDFSVFWKWYPRKVAKEPAWKAWRQLKGSGENMEAVVNAARCYAVNVKDTEERFILHAATFLRQRRFDDFQEISESAKEWATIKDLVKRRGRYLEGPLPVSEAAINALRAIGGYTKICDSTEAGMAILEKKFHLNYGGGK